MNVRQADGCTLREHLLSGYEQTGIMPEELASVPKLSPYARHVWAFFEELHRARGYTGFGPLPISFRDIEAWQGLMGQRLDPWELRAILAIDAEYIASASKTKPTPGA